MCIRILVGDRGKPRFLFEKKKKSVKKCRETVSQAPSCLARGGFYDDTPGFLEHVRTVDCGVHIAFRCGIRTRTLPFACLRARSASFDWDGSRFGWRGRNRG